MDPRVLKRLLCWLIDWHVAANAWVVETRRMDDIMRRYGCLNSEVRL